MRVSLWLEVLFLLSVELRDGFGWLVIDLMVMYWFGLYRVWECFLWLMRVVVLG